MVFCLYREIDQYGFERAEDFDYDSYEKFMAEYLSVLARRLAKWEKMLKGTPDVSRSSKGKTLIFLYRYYVTLLAKTVTGI